MLVLLTKCVVAGHIFILFLDFLILLIILLHI
jgi:hypothetical protein